MTRDLVDFMAASKAKKAIKDTWGHLRAKPGKHTGYIIYTCAEYGELVSIASSFSGVSGSPWFYQAQHDFMANNSPNRGEIYLFTGYYKLGKGEDNVGSFHGDISEIDPLVLLKTDKNFRKHID